MDTPRLEVKKFYIFLNFCFFLILFDPTNNKKQSQIVIKRNWEDIWMGLEEIRWRKECGMGERQTKHTKTENRRKKQKRESRTHHPKQNSSNVLSVSLLYQVYRLPPLPPTPPEIGVWRGRWIDIQGWTR